MQLLTGLFIYIISQLYILQQITCHDHLGSHYTGKTNKEVLIEPHALTYKDSSKPKLAENAEWTTNSQFLQEQIFYKRLINILLSRSSMKEEDDMLKGTIRIFASPSQIESLKSFGTGKISIRQVDEILAEILIKPKIDYFDEVVYFTDKLFKIANNHREICMGAVGVIITYLFIRKIKFTPKLIFLFTINIILIISYFMTWYQLIQEAEVNAFMKQTKFSEVPISCHPHKMSLWEKFKHLFSTNDECEEYYKSVLTNPKLKITPALVLSHFVTTVLIHPLSVIGFGVADFIDAATSKLGIVSHTIVTPILFLGIVAFIVILPFTVFGGSIGFSLGPLFSFKIGNDSKPRERIKDERIEKIHENTEAISPSSKIADEQPKCEERSISEYTGDKTVETQSNAKDLNPFYERNLTLNINLRGPSGDATHPMDTIQRMNELCRKCECENALKNATEKDES